MEHQNSCDFHIRKTHNQLYNSPAMDQFNVVWYDFFSHSLPLVPLPLLSLFCCLDFLMAEFLYEISSHFVNVI